MTRETADKIFDILMDTTGVKEVQRGEFLHHRDDIIEFRLYTGQLGFGGKFWNNGGRWYVTCYRESETPDILGRIARANERLVRLKEQTDASYE